jgi:hypothetical protein
MSISFAAAAILLPLLDHLRTLAIRNIESFSGVLISGMRAGAIPQLKSPFISTREGTIPCAEFTDMLISRCYLNQERSNAEEKAVVESLTKVKIVMITLDGKRSFSGDQLKEFESIQSKAGAEIYIRTGDGILSTLP